MPLSFSSSTSYIVNASQFIDTGAGTECIVIRTRNTANQFKLDTAHNRPFFWEARGY